MNAPGSPSSPSGCVESSPAGRRRYLLGAAIFYGVAGLLLALYGAYRLIAPPQ